MGTGRPSIYTDELADRICAELAKGRSLLSICREDWTPEYQTVTRWAREDRKPDGAPEGHEGFGAKYARAREDQAEYDADRIRALAEAMEQCTSRDQVAGLTAAANEYRWLAGKRKPRTFGDRQTHEHTGEGGGVLQVVFKVAEEPPPDAR